MDFIERWLGISPDGGAGALEITLVLVMLLVMAALMVGVVRLRVRRER